MRETINLLKCQSRLMFQRVLTKVKVLDVIMIKHLESSLVTRKKFFLALIIPQEEQYVLILALK